MNTSQIRGRLQLSGKSIKVCIALPTSSFNFSVACELKLVRTMDFDHVQLSLF